MASPTDWEKYHDERRVALDHYKLSTRTYNAAISNLDNYGFYLAIEGLTPKEQVELVIEAMKNLPSDYDLHPSIWRGWTGFGVNAIHEMERVTRRQFVSSRYNLSIERCPTCNHKLPRKIYAKS